MLSLSELYNIVEFVETEEWKLTWNSHEIAGISIFCNI